MDTSVQIQTQFKPWMPQAFPKLQPRLCERCDAELEHRECGCAKCGCDRCNNGYEE